MRSLLYLIIAITIFSCNNRKTNQKQTSSNVDSSAKKTAINAVDSESLERLKAFEYDTSIYIDYLPVKLKGYIDSNLKDWKLPDPGEWDLLWFQTYKKSEGLVDFIKGDFNCDNKKDYALILSNKMDSSLTIWVIQSTDNGFISTKLEDFDRPLGHIQVGLELLEPTRINYIDPDSDETESIKLNCQSIQVSYFEKGATTYFWKDGKYNSTQTGD